MKAKSWLQGALILSTLLSSAWSHADDSAPATVTEGAEIQLKNGDTMRGSIVSVEPGQRVIVIVAGEQSVIPWNEVAKIVGGPTGSAPTTVSTVPTPPPAAAPAPAPVAPPTEPTKGMPFVHVESDWSEVELQRVEGEIGGGIYTSKNQIGPQTLSKYMCEAPCDKLVDGRDGNRFFFSAPGMMPSRQFRLEQRDGYITARVHGVSLGRILGGVLLTTTGGIFTLSGSMLFGFSFLPGTPTAKNPDPDRAASSMRTASLVIGGIGIGTLVTGIYMVSAGQTKVELIKNNRGETALSLDRGVFRF